MGTTRPKSSSTRSVKLLGAFLAFAALFLQSQYALAAQVHNPGDFRAEIRNGTLDIGENHFDIGTDLPCAKGTIASGPVNNGCSPTVFGTISATGAISIPTSGVEFPPVALPAEEGACDPPAVPGSTSNCLIVRIQPTNNAWTGSLDPLTGASTMSGSLRVKIEGSASGVGLGGNCFVGNATTGIPINPLTSGALPANGNIGPVMGSPYDEDAGLVSLVNNTFAVPASSGCGGILEFIVGPALNSALGLPSASGNNQGAFEFTWVSSFDDGVNPPESYVVPVAPIRPALEVDPDEGRAPLEVDFDASGTTAQPDLEITEYRWDFEGDDAIDEVTEEPTAEHTYMAPDVYTAKLTVAAEDEAENEVTASVTAEVTVTGAIATITSGPDDPTNQTTASFEFTNSEPGGFECSLDGGEFEECESGVTYEDLTQGQHAFEVRGLDDEDVPGLPATFNWFVDLTDPVPSFTDVPPAQTNSLTEYDFGFEATDNHSAPEDIDFECRLDSDEPEDFEPCTSPHPVEWELEEGTHTLDVRATDEAGNTSSAITHTWEVDLTPPATNVTGTPTNTLTGTPATLENPTNQNGNANAAFAFESSEAGSTFICKFNAADERPCNSPIQTGTGSTGGQTRLGTPVQGANTFTVWAVDAAGNRDPDGDIHEYTFDTVQPSVSFSPGFLPPARTNQTSFNVLAVANEPIAETSANVAGNGFECSLDATNNAGYTAGAPFCHRESDTLGRQQRSGVAAGSRTIRVRATDLAGNLASGANIATYTYTVDLTAPLTAIASGPPSGSVTNSDEASFTFNTTNEGVGTNTFECRLDEGAWEPCGSVTGNAVSDPFSYDGLADGEHTFEVRAIDEATNVGPAASRTWTIGTASVTIDEAPAAISNDGAPAALGTATFEFSSNGDPEDTFECRQKPSLPFADPEAGWAACESPEDYTNLAQGTQQFEVRAIPDGGGDPGFPAVYQWVVDTIAPSPAFTAGPPALTNLATDSFELTFNAADPNGPVSFECRYDSTDEEDFEACESPETAEWDAEEHAVTHSFEIRGTDLAGNTSSIVTRSWTTDAIRPDATVEWNRPDAPIVSQCGATTGGNCPGTSGTNQNNRFNYTSSEATRTGATPGGPPGTAGFRCEFNDGAERDCVATSSGATTGNVQIGGGNQSGPTQPRLGTPIGAGIPAGALNELKVWAVDAAGNVSEEPVTATFTYDIVAPTMSRVNPTEASFHTNQNTDLEFEYASNEETSVFACSLNSTAGGGYAPCSGGGDGGTAGTHTLDGPLADGQYLIRVRGTDLSAPANQNPNNAAALWTVVVDTVDPITEISEGPEEEGLSGRSVSFVFNASNQATGLTEFECKLDTAAGEGDWEQCGSATGSASAPPVTYQGLEEGEHTFSVRATDEAGNEGEATSRTWTVDDVLPTATITSGPDPATTSTSAEFSFEADKVGSTFECRLDSDDEGDWAECESPADYEDLEEGEHRFEVRATDELDNEGPVASYEWAIDLTDPVVTIDSGPADRTNATTAEFEFSAVDESTVSFQCDLDGAGFGPCESPLTLTGLSDADHLLSVKAIDAAGNESETAEYPWTVKATGPQVTIDSGPASGATSPGATFTFSTDDPDAVLFECSLDAAPFEACVSPKNYAGLAAGDHAFRVRATDDLGNVGAPATHQWSIASERARNQPAFNLCVRNARLTFRQARQRFLRIKKKSRRKQARKRALRKRQRAIRRCRARFL